MPSRLQSPTDSELIAFSLLCIVLSVVIWLFSTARYLIRSQPFAELPTSDCPEPIEMTSPDFYRLFILASRPFVIRGGVRRWPALSLWADDAYLR